MSLGLNPPKTALILLVHVDAMTVPSLFCRMEILESQVQAQAAPVHE